jgi:hypothetical protein
LEYEKRFDYQRLIDECLEGVTTICFSGGQEVLSEGESHAELPQ